LTEGNLSEIVLIIAITLFAASLPRNQIKKMSAYTNNGFKNRSEYLASLAEEYEGNEDVVYMMADLLGPTEDFDGLVTSLEDELG